MSSKMATNKSERSFSAETKAALNEQEIKKKCCRYAFNDGRELFDDTYEGRGVPLNIPGGFKCQNCLREFLKALFIYRGSVTDPMKENHLDFSFSESDECLTAGEALRAAGFMPKSSSRKGKLVLYFKDNDTIGDFLGYIGAHKAAFDVINSKIIKDFRNNANRQVNCDTANIEKAISASQKYVDAINYLTETGALSALPEELREAAQLRTQFTQASLSELASRCAPPITKSGMKHRLEKLLAAAEDRKCQENV